MRNFLILCFFAVTLAGCQSSCDGSPECFAELVANTKQTMGVTSYRSVLGGSTVKTWSAAHGTQFEYLSADGRAYLVYPGNTRVLRGRWEIIHPKYKTDICFLYPSNSYNPVTEESGGRWECRRIEKYMDQLDELRKGDPLRLARTNKLPKILPRGINISIPTAMKEVGYKTKLNPNKICKWNPQDCRP